VCAIHRIFNSGTGYGLASAYGIVNNHDGLITVYSEPDRGTTYNIYLPVSDQPVVQALDLAILSPNPDWWTNVQLWLP
jgi:K+-sensing histidine kinase KdpD